MNNKKNETKTEDYIEKYEKNLFIFGLFAFIILGVVFLVFLMPKMHNFYSNNNPGYKNNSGSIDYTEKNKSNPEENYKSGITFFDRNNYSAALDFFEKAVAAQPKNIDYLSELASTHYRLKNYKKAIESYKKIIELDPDNVNAYNSIGNIYWIMKDYNGAENYFRKAIEIDNSYLASYNNLALMFYENGEKEKAIEVLNSGIANNSNNTELKMTLKIIK